MAMTEHDDTPVRQSAEELIDGHSVDELDDYLSAGRKPYNPSIENSASCLLYLSALARLRNRSWRALTREAAGEPDRDELWITSLLDTIKNEVRAGRDIPIRHPDPTIRLTVTEAAVQGLIRDVADSLDGIILGRTVLVGDVTLPGEPVEVRMTVAAEYGHNLVSVTERLRHEVARALAEHTELMIVTIGITVEDVYRAREDRP
ncbi:hypothetical protein B7R21_09535 [Subtercola boreus]|uniref:Asp23/Gls24 family envelope stress response protein n=1 Tax=Subtercola boreus TaxID=120213 RepID=A0A3E0VST4_9MICO|nr:Asp23/Gls24 family envelope stress response protein [Subtercola boreus]RFA12579.1 hypothetical protein B7R21_09535 [Subtercola boreus]